jgi:hypothetical protein
MPDMDCTPVTGTLATPGNTRRGRVMKTDQVDEAGDPVYYMDARAVMQFMANEVKESNLKALEHLNKYIALARQRGCGEVTLMRLKEAARREGDSKVFLKWLDRTSSYLPEETFVFEVLGLGMRR